MADFNPDAFLAQSAPSDQNVAQSAPSDQNVAPTQQSSPDINNEQQGFDPDAFLKQANEEHYSQPGEQFKAGLEGAARGFVGSAAPFLERTAGIKPEDMLGRTQAAPLISGLGEATGLVLGAVTGTGEAALMEHAGQAAASAVGLADLAKNASLISKVGSSAVKQATEMAVLASSDETSKMIMQDPNTSAESAIANIGLGAALGGAGGAFLTGAVSPLWNATIGPKLEGGLKALTSRIGGQEGAQSTASTLEKEAGVELQPEFKAVIDDRPGAKESHSVLSQDDTSITGRKYQNALEQKHNDLADKVVENLGKDPNDIEKMPDLDKYSRGRDLGQTLADEIKPIADEIGGRYDQFTEKFKNSPLSEGDYNVINEQIGKQVLEQGWNKSASNAELNLAENVMGKMKDQTNVNDLKKFITNLRDANPYGSSTYKAAKSISDILKDNQERVISNNIVNSGGKNAADEIANYTQLRGDYAKIMRSLEDLNVHVRVGKFQGQGPQGFVKKLQQLSTQKGESVLDRLNGKNNADILNQLKAFPETLNKVKQFHVDSLIDKSSNKTLEGTKVNINALLANVDKATPQIKELIASPEQQLKINAIGKIVAGLKDPNHNFSNTARTISKLAHGSPSPISIVASMAGHAGVGLAAWLAQMGIKEGIPAGRLALMKFLSSEQPIAGPGFKAMASFIDNAYKGNEFLTKAATNVLKPSFRVLTESQMPTQVERSRLDRLVAKNDQEPTSPLNGLNSHVGHYLPEHQRALAQASTQQLQYLQQLKPRTTQPSPLDTPIEPTKTQVARYHRALDIATQPAVVLQHVKDGTLQTTDLQDLKALYPSVFNKMVGTLSNQLATSVSKNEPIPYRTRIAISLFLGQPTDTSMSPSSIQAAQPKGQMPQNPPTKGGKLTNKAGTDMNKNAKMYRTPGQSAEEDRGGRE